MPVKLGLKRRAVVGLHHVNAERQPANHFANEEDRGALVARIEDLQDANPGAIVDRRELMELERAESS